MKNTRKPGWTQSYPPRPALWQRALWTLEGLCYRVGALALRLPARPSDLSSTMTWEQAVSRWVGRT